jgi:hypothetical protein
MTAYLYPAGCMHKDRMGMTVEGVRPNYFTIDEGGVRSERSVEVLFLGEVHQEIVFEGVDSNGYQFADLRLVFFAMEGNHPRYGRLKIVHDTQRPGTFGRLLAVDAGQKFPVVHTTYLNVLAVAEKMPGIVLQNRGAPLRFVSERLTAWPPTSNVYHLRTDVEFEARANPGPVVLSARAAPVYLEKA